MKSAWIAVACALLACDGGGQPAEGDAGPGGAGGGGGDLGGCEALFDDCPIGTTPSLEASLVAQCGGQAGAEVADIEGNITGVCESGTACTLVCSFSNPCRCGVDRITREGVFCAECGAQGCGNGVCEGGESPQTCPSDCGPQCDPGGDGRPAEQRCDGETRQVCEANARFADLACRDDQICEPYTGGAERLTFCQTRTNPTGGMFRGLAARPFEVTGIPNDIRFATPGLTCPAQRIGILRTVIEETGGVLFIDGDPIVRMDLDSRVCEVLPLHGLGSPVDFAGGRAVVGRARALTLWEEATGRAYQTTPFVDDYVDAPISYVTLSPDGQWAAAAMAIDGQPMVAVWSAATGEVYRLLRIADAEVVAPLGESARHLRFSGAHLFEVRGNVVVVWDLETGRYVEVLDFGVPVLRSVPDPSGAPRLAVLTVSGVVMRDLAERRTLWQIPLVNQGLAVDFGPDGTVVAVGTFTQAGAIVVALLRAEDGRLVRNLDAGLYDRGWLEVLFAPDGHHLIVNTLAFSDRFTP